LRALLGGSLELLLLVDDRGTITSVSPRLASALGWTEEQLVGASMFHLLAPGEVAPTVRALAAVMLSDGERVAFSVTLRHRRGGDVPVDVVARHADGDAPRVVLRATAPGPAWAGGVAPLVALPLAAILHDLGNVLTAIQGSADAIEDRVTPELMSEWTALRDAIRRAIELGRQLRGAPAPAPAAGDLNEAVRSWLRLVQHAWADDVVLDAQLSPALPRVALGAEELQGLVGNLLYNAKEALTTRGRVGVRTWREGPTAGDGRGRGAEVMLEISDEGAGMDETILAAMFRPYFSTKARTGRGFGLAATRAAVERVGGRIEVRSAPGIGSTFTIALPVAGGAP
jgi:PAS domain S-box-containing protein